VEIAGRQVEAVGGGGDGELPIGSAASEMFWDPLATNLAVLQMFMKNSVNSSLAHRQAVCNLPGGYSTILPHKGVHCSN